MRHLQLRHSEDTKIRIGSPKSVNYGKKSWVYNLFANLDAFSECMAIAIGLHRRSFHFYAILEASKSVTRLMAE